MWIELTKDCWHRRKQVQSVWKSPAGEWFSDVGDMELSETSEAAAKLILGDAFPVPFVPPAPTATTVPAIGLDYLELSMRAYNVLSRAGMDTLDDLVKRTRRDLLDLKNAGRVTVDEIESMLAERGLKLRGPRGDN